MIILRTVINNVLDQHGNSISLLKKTDDFFKFSNKLSNLNIVRKGCSIDKVLDDSLKEYVKKEFAKKKGSGNLYYKKGEEWFFIKKKTFIVKMLDFFNMCTYCGKIPITPMSNDSYSSQLDHFFRKETYPQFGLDPYNLIISCPACNGSVGKGQKDFHDGLFFHPYFGRFFADNIGKKNYLHADFIDKCFDSTYVFGYNYKDDGVWKLINNNINDKYSEKLNKHLEFFSLFHIYSAQDTLNEYECFLNRKNQILSYGDCKVMLGCLEDKFSDRMCVFRDGILKHTNGKMKKDLVNRLKEEIENL